MQTLKKVGRMRLTHSLTHSLLKLSRNFGAFKKKVLVFLLTFSLLFSQFSIFIPPVYAASSPWTQTDWSGGSGQTNWLDATKFDSSSSVTTSTAGQVTLAATSSWYNTSWAYRRKITFDNSAQAENLTNFPVLVKLDSTRINYSNTQNSGQDIRFTDSDGTTLLSYEIEKWDETGNSFVWVKVPQIDASSSTDYIYMYYGNTSATDAQAATSVWDSNFKGVWHLPNGTTLTANDSTSNTNNGTITGATAGTGQIDGAGSFNGSNNYVSVADSASLRVESGSFTVSVWIKPSVVQQQAILFKGNPNMGNGYILVMNRFGSDITLTKGGVIDQAVSYTFQANTWYNIVAVQPLAGNVTYYINGASIGSYSNTSAYSSSSGQSLYIGDADTYFANKYNGLIDEIRISNSTRSSDWILASYKSEADTFNAFASEEGNTQSSGTLTSSIFDTEFTSGAAWGTLTYTATTPANTSVSVKARTSNSSSMTGATAFSSCTAITSGSDISSNSCVTDSHRYIQYQLSLANTDSVSTPTFQDISIAFSTYDSTAPSISLTTLATDPNSDTTPTLSGTATESVGTVSNVQFQMDATSGSWTACTASDGSFNSSSEAFSCTASTLTDGSHTMYVRATDSNGNTTSSGSYASDTFTIDATNPVSIDLDSPGDNSYTNNERPTFKWKATTDATAGLSKYVLEIDNPSIGSGQPSGDFTIDDIPTSRTTDYETNKYLIHYENFSDSDSTNNYISVYTKSHNDWGSNENDGKLREGKVSWKVKARDNASNKTSSSRTLFVDRSNPNVEFTQVNDVQFSSLSSSRTSSSNNNAGDYSSNGVRSLSTTDKTPTIYGKITDPLAGGDSSQTQDQNGPKVASGPKSVEIKVEKKEGTGYKLHTIYTINMDKPWYTCDGKEVSDNSKQKCDKYLPFEYTPKDTLDLGTYKITLTGEDKADNSASETSFTLNITTLSRIITPEEKKIIEEKIKELPKEEKEKIKEEIEITKPTEAEKPSVLETVGSKIAGSLASLWWGLVDTGKTVAQATTRLAQGIIQTGKTTVGALANTWNSYQAFVIGTNQKTLALAKIVTGWTTSMITQSLAFTGQQVGKTFIAFGQATQTLLATAGQSIDNITKSAADAATAIGEGYNQLANNAPGVAKIILTGIRNGVSTATSTTASATNAVASATVTVARNIASTVGNAAETVSSNASSLTQNATTAIGNTFNAIATAATNVAQKTESAIASTTNGINQGVSQTAIIIGTTVQKLTKVPTQAVGQIAFGVKNMVANTIGPPINAVSQQTNRLIAKAELIIVVNSELLFDKKPTRILAVNVEKVTSTSAVIFWQTNHHATSAVNYGFDTSYGNKVQSSERVKDHRIELANLEPGKTYFFEVMSQNKNYVYDAYYTFTTPSQVETKVKGATTEKLLKKPVVEVVGNKNDWILVRKEPIRTGEIVAKVQVGQTFQLLKEQNGWLLIKFDGEEGWMFGEFGKLMEVQD